MKHSALLVLLLCATSFFTARAEKTETTKESLLTVRSAVAEIGPDGIHSDIQIDNTLDRSVRSVRVLAIIQAADGSVLSVRPMWLLNAGDEAEASPTIEPESSYAMQLLISPLASAESKAPPSDVRFIVTRAVDGSGNIVSPKAIRSKPLEVKD